MSCRFHATFITLLILQAGGPGLVAQSTNPPPSNGSLHTSTAASNLPPTNPANPANTNDSPNHPSTATNPSIADTTTAQPVPAQGNPFRLIAARNAFGIKDPPAPPPPVVDTPPPPPPTPSNVTLTGFTLWQGRKKVYLQITEPGSKAPSFHDMEEGDVQGEIEILSIDEKNETARIRNAGQEFTLNFKENGAKAAGGPAPGQPGAIPAPITAGVVNAGRPGGGPTVIGRGGVTDNPGASQGMDPGVNPAPVTANPAAQPASGGIYPTLPSRRQRTDSTTPTTPTSAPVVQPGQERVINGRVIPPPPPLPVFDAPVGE